MLLDLVDVIKHFQPASANPVQDLINRGVDQRAVDNFIEDCLVTAANSSVPGDKLMLMIAYSCFHVGMLTQEYLTEQRKEVDEDGAP